MATTVSNKTETRNVAEDIGPQPCVQTKKEDSLFSIMKAIHWPRFATAVKYALYCLIATGIIVAVLFGYHFLINQLASALL